LDFINSRIFKTQTNKLIFHLLIGDDMSRNAKKEPLMSLKEKRALKKESNKDKAVKPRKRRA
jgi:hypothetical protein